MGVPPIIDHVIICLAVAKHAISFWGKQFFTSITLSLISFTGSTYTQFGHSADAVVLHRFRVLLLCFSDADFVAAVQKFIARKADMLFRRTGKKSAPQECVEAEQPEGELLPV